MMSARIAGTTIGGTNHSENLNSENLNIGASVLFVGATNGGAAPSRCETPLDASKAKLLQTAALGEGVYILLRLRLV